MKVVVVMVVVVVVTLGESESESRLRRFFFLLFFAYCLGCGKHFESSVELCSGGDRAAI